MMASRPELDRAGLDGAVPAPGISAQPIRDPDLLARASGCAPAPPRRRSAPLRSKRMTLCPPKRMQSSTLELGKGHEDGIVRFLHRRGQRTSASRARSARAPTHSSTLRADLHPIERDGELRCSSLRVGAQHDHRELAKRDQSSEFIAVIPCVGGIAPPSSSAVGSTKSVKRSSSTSNEPVTRIAAPKPAESQDRADALAGHRKPEAAVDHDGRSRAGSFRGRGRPCRLESRTWSIAAWIVRAPELWLSALTQTVQPAVVAARTRAARRFGSRSPRRETDDGQARVVVVDAGGRRGASISIWAPRCGRRSSNGPSRGPAWPRRSRTRR